MNYSLCLYAALQPCFWSELWQLSQPTALSPPTTTKKTHTMSLNTSTVELEMGHDTQTMGLGNRSIWPTWWVLVPNTALDTPQGRPVLWKCCLKSPGGDGEGSELVLHPLSDCRHAVQLRHALEWRFPSNEKRMVKIMAGPEMLNHYHSSPDYSSVLHVHAHMHRPPEYIQEGAERRERPSTSARGVRHACGRSWHVCRREPLQHTRSFFPLNYLSAWCKNCNQMKMRRTLHAISISSSFGYYY